MKTRVLVTGGSGLLAVNAAVTLRSNYDIILALHERDIALSGVTTVRLGLDSKTKLNTAFS